MTPHRCPGDTLAEMFRWGLVLLAGCAQLAGIDNTSKGEDAGPTLSTLTLEHVSIGKTVIRSPHPVTALNAVYLVPDATAPGGQRKVTPTVVGTDTWSADLGGTSAPIQFQSNELPTTNLRILDFPTQTLRWAVPILEHPNPTPAPAGATLGITVGLPTPHVAESYQLLTIGAWSNVGLNPPAVGDGTLAPGPLVLTELDTPTRRVDKLTSTDSVLLLRYGGNQLVSHLDAPAFDQTGNDAITGAMTTTALDQTLDLRVNQNAAQTRLSTVRPAVGAASFVWRVHASPGLDYSILAGPQLNAEGLAAPVAADPQTITAAYGNPFSANYQTLLQWDIRAGRTYTNPSSMLTTTLSAGFTERAKPSAGLVLAEPAGLPDRITANGAVLNIDNVMVPAPLNAPVEVSFVTDAPTKSSVYAIQLIELVPTTMMTYTLTLVVTAHAAAPGTKLPRDLFKAGSLYVLRTFAFAGCYPAAATGDYTQQALPCAFSFADSGVFQVAP